MVLDSNLEQRLSLLEQSGQVDHDVAEFSREAVRDLAAVTGRAPTDEDFGTLSTHVALALQRARRGEAVTTWDVDHSAELAAHPHAVEAAEALIAQAAVALDIELPSMERQFIALHVAALGTRAA
jgi:transcriptional regulatory protein LevR